MYASGMSMADIASELGASTTTIYRALRRAGISFRKQLVDADRVRELVAQGMPRKAVATLLGVNLTSIYRICPAGQPVPVVARQQAA